MAAPQKPAPLRPEDVLQLTDDPLGLEHRDDLDLVVGLLPAQNFVRIARSLRENGRLDLLVPYATAAQLTSILDLDAWERDQIDPARARSWLVDIVDHYGHGARARERGQLAALIYDMDPEMWTYAVLHGTRVYELDPDMDEARQVAAELLGGLEPWESPDGVFMVGVPDDEFGRMALHVIKRVYEDSIEDGRQLLLSVMGGLPAPLEEDLLRWRSGRLADLGFVPWEEAMRLLRPLAIQAALSDDPSDAGAHIGEDNVPQVTRLDFPDLLGRIVERLDAHEHGVRAREFMLLVNEVMAAQRFEPGDRNLQERALEQTRATITLGLEMLAAARADHPDLEGLLTDRVTTIGLRSIFRVGFGALDKLRRAAATLHREGRVSLERVGSLLDRPWGPALVALGRRLPELPVTSTSRGVRPIRGLRDVDTATQLIAQAGALAAITFHTDAYAVDPTWLARLDEPDRITLGDLIRTAIVRHLLGRDPGFAPLTSDELDAAATELLITPPPGDDGPSRLQPGVIADFERRCAAAGVADQTEALAQVLLPRLQVELASLERPDGEVDLTKVGGVLTIQHVSMWLQTRTGQAPD